MIMCIRQNRQGFLGKYTFFLDTTNFLPCETDIVHREQLYMNISCMAIFLLCRISVFLMAKFASFHSFSANIKDFQQIQAFLFILYSCLICPVWIRKVSERNDLRSASLQGGSKEENSCTKLCAALLLGVHW